MDHGESENRGPKTLGSILRAPGPKNLKKCQNLKVITSWFPITKSTTRNPKIVVLTLGSILRAPGKKKYENNIILHQKSLIFELILDALSPRVHLDRSWSRPWSGRVGLGRVDWGRRSTKVGSRRVKVGKILVNLSRPRSNCAIN